MMRKNSRLFNIASKTVLICFGVLLALIIVEIQIRIYMGITARRSFKQGMQNLPVLPDGIETTLGDIIQPNPSREIIYELRPDLNVQFIQQTVKTNSQGWRGNKDFLVKKQDNVVRIVGLGDSYMFGHGVGQGESALPHLEIMLNTNYPERQWEIINTAVPGYNTVMEVATLEKKALRFEPDIVIIEFIGNDRDLPNFLYDAPKWWAYDQLYIFSFISGRMKLAHDSFTLTEALWNERKNSFENHIHRVPKAYKHMVGWEAYDRSLKRLKKLQDRFGFDVLHVITSNGDRSRVVAISESLGFITTYNRYDRHEVISPSDNHPSVKRHRATAELIQSMMQTNGLIDKYLDAWK